MSPTRRTALFIVALAPLLCGQGDRGFVQPQIQRKLALVIGNSAYPKAQLKNPVNDAVAMEATLKRLGFQVTLVRDADLRKMRGAIDDFASTLGPDSLGFFYFAGHGLQVNRTNYLVPVDFSAVRQEDVQYEAYPADRVRDILDGTGARLRILVLDACRNNPWKYTRGGGDGLAPMEASATGTLIAYATGDNNTAADNPADMNGLYTKFLMPALLTPGLNLREVFQKTKEDVNEASRGQQNPTVYENIIGKYFLGGGPLTNSQPNTVSPVARVDVASVMWARVENSKDPLAFDDFALAYPNSEYAAGAKMIAAELRRAARPSTVVAAPGMENANDASTTIGGVTFRETGGHISRLNSDGREVWSFTYSSAGNSSLSHKTWPAGYDPETHLLYWGLGGIVPDEARGSRLFALNADTGKLNWAVNFREDAAPAANSTLAITGWMNNGHPRKVLLWQSGIGIWFVLDRVTGEKLYEGVGRP